jgi:hypothetical protein
MNMKSFWPLAVLTLINLALLVSALARIRPAAAEAVPGVMRGRSLQIVDERGRVRASLEVLPAKKQPNGEVYPETVLLRLITERGRPSVKIGTSEQAAGVTLVGPTGTRDTYLILQSKGVASSLQLKNEDGRELNLRP